MSLSNYFLGKIAYDLGKYNEAETFLNDFLDNSENAMLVCGAIKRLVDIYLQENDFSKSFEMIAKAKMFNINNISEMELKLLEITTFLKINDLKNARNELDKILENKNLPMHIKQKSDELAGLL